MDFRKVFLATSIRFQVIEGDALKVVDCIHEFFHGSLIYFRSLNCPIWLRKDIKGSLNSSNNNNFIFNRPPLRKVFQVVLLCQAFKQLCVCS